MKKIITFFLKVLNNLKIKQKTFALIILTAFISSGLIFLSSYIIYKRSVKQRVQHYNYSIIGQTIKNIDTYFQSLQNIAYSITYNPDLQDYFTSSNKSGYEQAQQTKFITNALRYYYHSQANVQMCIFLENNDYEFYTLDSYVNRNYNYKEDEWYKQISQSKSEKIIIFNNPQNYYDAATRKSVISVIYKITSNISTRTLGYMVMDIDYKQLQKFFQSEYVDVRNTTILSENNEIIYGFPNDFSLKEANLTFPDGKEWGFFDNKFGKDEHMVIYGTSEYTRWKIVNTVSYSDLLKELSATRYMYLIISILVLLVTLITSYGFSSLIMQPIQKLKKAMTKVKSGEFNFTVTTPSNDELGRLVDDFNSMVKRIDYLMKKNESDEILKREAQLKALQQQINPHFLYNTLEMIMGAASDNSKEQVIEICKSLGKMLRYNLNFNRVEPIAYEVEQIKNYLYIMGLRFEDKFQSELDVDPEALRYNTVKFTLQPFIENSILHGFRDTLRGGLLKLGIKKNGDVITISIIDNGKGFSTEELASINEKIKLNLQNSLEIIERNPKLGLMNVYLRLKLLFGDKCKFTITSEPNISTVIAIEIPAI